ncbi:YciI family protein [Hyphobacterium sp. CCMP332]|uniref:YciI family protein n=1 Tax=Hyphobacterium sp. CCMP332 TaxID=2749086 RepID=UPI00164F5281|nr:YciI family protein [Hyphobacterium sp. CCMP332]QNL19968.1 YciI family protein [Hyphobacterium sp. CCMP332]
MAFVVRATDRAGALEIRKANREAHLEFLKAAGDRLLLAGPLLTGAGEMAGSLLIVDFDTAAAVTEWLAADPYSNAGLFESVEITGFKPVLANFPAQ